MDKGYRGLGMEGSVARWYDKTTRHDMGEFRKLAQRLVAELPHGGDVLEVAPGPGFLAIELARDRRVRMTGLDVSRTFVELASRNAADAAVSVDFRLGNAAAMPFADNSFDLLVCRAAFKNFSQPQAALREMLRVLRPGGQGLVIDLRRDAAMADIRRYVDGLRLGLGSRTMTLFTFRFMMLKRAYTVEEMRQMVDSLGFSRAEVTVQDVGMEVTLRK